MNSKIIVPFVILLFVLNACKQTPSKYIYNEGFIYGTIYHIVYESPEGKDLQEEIQKKLNEYNRCFPPTKRNR